MNQPKIIGPSLQTTFKLFEVSGPISLQQKR